MPAQATIAPLAAKVSLDRERVIIYDRRAEYRMGTLDKPFNVHDLRRNRRAYAALVAWLWACLSERDALDFPSPEHLAPHVGVANLDAAFIAFIETWNAGQPLDSGDKSKNG